MTNNQPYLSYMPSPWPLLISINSMNLIINLINYMKYSLHNMLILSCLLIINTIYMWFKQLFYESLMGKQNFLISFNLKLSFILFILSEILLFISMFWNFFNSFDQFNWMNWPPKFIELLNYQEIPLLNTFILLSSSLTITMAHNLIMKNMYNKSIKYVIMTIILSFYFLILQYYEFSNCKFNINDSIYSNSFFIITGLHGSHVMMGTIFLISILMMKKWYFLNHHLNFEFAAWYWHFVDMIWLFVYSCVYWLMI